MLVLAWLVGLSGGGVRLYRKTPAHLARQGISGVQVRLGFEEGSGSTRFRSWSSWCQVFAGASGG